jgi:ABC-type lipoprotein export system ATPase subunit
MIKTVDLHKSFGSEKTFITKVIKGINLNIQDGEFVSIVGPSGSGKSTLLNLLSTLEQPTTGKIYYNDLDITQLNEKQLAHFRNITIGFIFQSHHLFPELTAYENTLIPASIAGTEKEFEERARHLLERVGLGNRAEHKPSQLSGGQNQRVAIARAVLLKPDCIFADEPTGNLDQKSSMEVFTLLQELNQEQKTTIVMVTHDQHLADQASRQISIVDGQLI